MFFNINIFRCHNILQFRGLTVIFFCKSFEYLLHLQKIQTSKVLTLLNLLNICHICKRFRYSRVLTTTFLFFVNVLNICHICGSKIQTFNRFCHICQTFKRFDSGESFEYFSQNYTTS